VAGTDDDTRAAVTYIGLPISSGGAQSLGRMSRRVAFERTMAFLATCTQPIEPIVFRFRVQSVPAMRPPLRLQWSVKRRFGDDVAIPADRVPEALDFLDEIDPQPTNEWGMAAVWFWATSRFRVLDPATGQPLPARIPTGSKLSNTSGRYRSGRVPCT